MLKHTRHPLRVMNVQDFQTKSENIAEAIQKIQEKLQQRTECYQDASMVQRLLNYFGVNYEQNEIDRQVTEMRVAHRLYRETSWTSALTNQNVDVLAQEIADSVQGQRKNQMSTDLKVQIDDNLINRQARLVAILKKNETGAPNSFTGEFLFGEDNPDTRLLAKRLFIACDRISEQEKEVRQAESNAAVGQKQQQIQNLTDELEQTRTMLKNTQNILGKEVNNLLELIGDRDSRLEWADSDNDSNDGMDM